MNKIIILLLILLCISCSTKTKTELLFIADKNAYWQCKNYCYPEGGGTYFQFKEIGTYDVYLRTEVGFGLFNNDGDLQSGPRTWSIKNDLVLLWDRGTYKIEKITNKQIILSYYHYKIKEKKCFVRMSKWILTPKGPKLLDELDTVKK
jgi:hypothetical protein